MPDVGKMSKYFCIRVTEGLLPGTSGSAARGLLGLWSIEGEIEKKKLSFLGRRINSSHDVAQRKLLMVRIMMKV